MNTDKFYDDLFKVAQRSETVSQDLAQALTLWESGNYWEAIAKLQQATRNAQRLEQEVGR